MALNGRTIEKEKESPKTILVVEDDADLLAVLKMLLEKNGYEVMVAADGSQAVKVFSSRPTDLVITDLVMPEKSGLDLLQELKMFHSYLKVIAISGGPAGNAAWLPIAKKLGALRVLKKPFSNEALLEAVREVIAAEVYSV